MQSESEIRRIREDPFAGDLLQALPLAVVVLQAELSIVALNGAAEKVFGAAETEVVGRRPGDAFHCVNASLTQEGCGHSVDCGHCVLRRAGLAAIAGQRVEQEEFRVRLRQDGAEAQKVVLLSAAPFRHGGEDLAVVLLQDVTVLHRLRGLIPICAACKKIRRDDQAWQALEAYISDRSHAEFTHSLCPDCVAELYPDLPLPGR
ncbi:MAG: hypothetical protein Kow0092_16050 [Deferrisomatales bacterium]